MALSVAVSLSLVLSLAGYLQTPYMILLEVDLALAAVALAALFGGGLLAGRARSLSCVVFSLGVHGKHGLVRPCWVGPSALPWRRRSCLAYTGQRVAASFRSLHYSLASVLFL